MIYDKLAAGERIRKQRTFLGYSRDQMAEQVGRATKYCADIERGQCGMSVDTLLKLSEVLNLSMDYIIKGTQKENSQTRPDMEQGSQLHTLLEYCPSDKLHYAIEILKIYLQSCH